MATHRSGLLQEDLEYHKSTGYDIIFECWAVADRLSLHVIAADCEWATAKLWNTESVYARAAQDLSPGALHRIARSLCAGTDAACKALDRVQELADQGLHIGNELKNAKSGLDAIVSAQTMLEWRLSSEG